ncbi:MMPL family transporter [Streptomyces sp. NPDC059466]|uniref:MMPL family transporter n=1 Tax=unclassified Streptomyces TaxID=2593676 RepID=UPI0036A4586D
MSVLARWCFRHPFRVIGMWAAVLVALAVPYVSHSAAYSDAFSLPGAESSKALARLEASESKQSGDSDQIVVHVRGDRSVRDAAVRRKVIPMLHRVAKLPSVASVTSMYGPAGVARVSRDGKTAYATVTFDSQADRVSAADVTRVIDTAQAARDKTLQVELGGEAIGTVAQGKAKSTEAIGLVAAGIILFVAFGSLLGMALPLLVAVAALGAGLITVGLASHVITVGSDDPTVAALVGLGVGIDYALFIVTRYRTGLQSGLAPEPAAVRALDTSGRAVLFAGLTVVTALLGLLVLRIGPASSMGISAATAVLFTVTAAVTLLPALLGIFGNRLLSRRQRRAMPSREPGTAHPTLNTYGQARPQSKGRWAERVEHHKTLFTVVALLAVTVLSLPTLSMRLGTLDAGNDPRGTTTRAAYDLLAQGFGPGSNGPLVLVAQQAAPNDAAALEKLVATVRSTRGVASATARPVTTAKGLSIIDVVPTSAPQDKATSTLISHLRKDVVPAAEQGNGLTVYVGGRTAVSADLADVLASKLPVFLGVIVGLGCLLLMVAFRSIVVPLTAAVMNLLASGGSFGVVVAVFQWGWGCELLGLGKAGPVAAELPVIMLAILFGLSMDYQVFLVSRIHEEWEHTRDSHRAIRIGQAETGRLINAAALIMICVFTAFVFGGQRVIAEYGVGLAAAVTIDAFILRTVLVPALMHLLGRANWWLPAWLERILPRVSIEGAPSRQPIPAGSTPAAPVPGGPIEAERTAAPHRNVATTAIRSGVVPAQPEPSPQHRAVLPGLQPQQTSTARTPKSVLAAYLWWFFLGVFGIHHFYLGRKKWGLVHLFTLGICGLGWLVDSVTLPRQVRSANARIALRDVDTPAEWTGAGRAGTLPR